MTGNQIQYQRNLETQRHNLVSESQGWADLNERARHNLVSEAQGWATIQETHRHNVQTEALGWSTLAENVRHNKANEAIGWANYNVSVYNAKENARHNRATESISWKVAKDNYAIGMYNAKTNRMNAETNRMNAQTNRKNSMWQGLNTMANLYNAKSSRDKWESELSLAKTKWNSEKSWGDQRVWNEKYSTQENLNLGWSKYWTDRDYLDLDKQKFEQGKYEFEENWRINAVNAAGSFASSIYGAKTNYQRMKNDWTLGQSRAYNDYANTWLRYYNTFGNGG